MTFFRVFICILIAAAAAAGGLILGIRYEQSVQDAEETREALLESRPRVIAVASLDEGVDTDGVNQKYAVAIIESLGGRFSLTTYQMAQKGLTDGAYDAIVVFPPDFSEKVSSVNAMNPRKISVDYLISEQLPERIYIDTFQTLEDFQADVNATLSYMYLVSIYDELHDAQDKSGKLLSNNEKTLESIEDVDAYDFVQNLDMGDIPQIRLDFQPADFQPFVDHVNGFAKDMSDVYLSSYLAAKDGYQAVTDQLLPDIQNTKDIGAAYVNDVSSWQQTAGGWLADAGAYKGDLETWTDGFETWRTDSNVTIGDYKTNFDSNISEIENYRTLLSETADLIYDTIEIILDAGSSPDTDPLQEILDDRDAALQDPLRPDEAAFDALKDLGDAVAALEEYSETFPDDSAVQNFPDASAINFGDFTAAISAVETTAFSFDPLAYLTDADKAKAEGIIGAYESEVSKTKGEFDKLQSDHFELVTGAYTEYSKHAGELHQNVYEAYSDELKQVGAAKDLFVGTGRTTNTENRTLISDFASKMPNTRSGQSVNQTIAEFIAAPVELTHADIRAALTSGRTGDLRLPWIILYICLAAIVITAIVRIVRDAGNRKKAALK
jgi:hypothetical protein